MELEPEIADAFDQLGPLRRPLLRVRSLIFDAAAGVPNLGPIRETLKWGQPAYIPERPRTGSTIRLGAISGSPLEYGIFVHCQSSLVPTFQDLYADRFRFGGNRSLIFGQRDKLPEPELRHCIQLALTYHRWKHADELPTFAEG